MPSKDEIQAALKAKLAERLNRKPYMGPDQRTLRADEQIDPNASGYSKDDRARDADVKKWEEDPNHFPTALVTGAVRAMDVLMPEELERQVTTIARMHMEKKGIKAIAAELDLPEEYVRAELRKIDIARGVAIQHEPELAVKVVEAQFDVMAASTAMFEDGMKVLSALKEELMLDHFDKLNPPPEEYDQDGAEDEDTGKKKAKKRPRPLGMYSMKVDSYFKGVESLGKQLDRIGEMTGQLGKHIPPGSGSITQINQTVNLANENLNSFVDSIMKATGNVIPPPHRPYAVVDAEAETVEE